MLSLVKQLCKTVDRYGLRSFVNAIVFNEGLVDGIDKMPTQLFCNKQEFVLQYYTTRSDRLVKIQCTVQLAMPDYEELGSLSHISIGSRHTKHNSNTNA